MCVCVCVCVTQSTSDAELLKGDDPEEEAYTYSTDVMYGVLDKIIEVGYTRAQTHTDSHTHTHTQRERERERETSIIPVRSFAQCMMSQHLGVKRERESVCVCVCVCV